MEYFITQNQQSIFYQRHGSATGIPIVFIHGFPFSHEMWDKQVDYLKDEYTIITFDLRGLGHSDSDDGQFTFEMMVDDFIEFLEHEHIDRAHVVGFSMGGYVALRAIEKKPEIFASLILADTQSLPDSDESKLKRTASIQLIQKGGLDVYAQNFLKNVTCQDTQANNPQLLSELRHMILKNAQCGVIANLLAMMGRTDTTENLPSIKVPTLILVGKDDRITPLAIAEKMQEKIPHAQLEVISKAGHMSNVENPEEFNREIHNFLLRYQYQWVNTELHPH